MAERLLVTKVRRTTQTQADLLGKGHKYADLRLFDLEELVTVGLDPATLPVGEERPARFWAIYEVSDKLNKAGHPYKDVIALEPVTGPAAPSAAVGDPELLAELRAIRGLLETLVAGQGLAVPPPPAPAAEVDNLDLLFPRYGDGQALGDNPAEVAAYEAFVTAEGHMPASLDALRSWAKARKANGGH